MRRVLIFTGKPTCAVSGTRFSNKHRLNGDYNPLHATPEFGEKMGYGGVINHGVFAYSNVAHEFVKRLGLGDPTSLQEISARFSGPVKPGDTVDVDVWKIGGGEGSEEIRWTAKVVSTDRPCLTDGRAVIKVSSVSKL